MIVASQVTPVIAILPPVEVSTVAVDVADTVCAEADIEQQIHHIRLSYFLIYRISRFSAVTGAFMRTAEKWIQPEQYEIVGAVLAATRRKADLTQAELARLLGKPQSFISAFEAGKRRVDLVEFLVIVRTLGADPVEIFAEIVSSVAGDVR